MPGTQICGKKIRILDFDGSLLNQRRLLSKFATPPFSTQIIDLKDIALVCRYLATKKNFSKLKKKLENTSHDAITFYGSGDFHHVSSVLISQLASPISVIVFDHHPDWDGMSPCVSCGSWVSEICKTENVKKVMLLGPSSDDLSSLGLSTAYLKGLENGKLEIFPYERKPSRTYFRYLRDCECFSVKRNAFGSTIYWNNLKQKNINYINELLKRIPTQDVYVSIDKDCLLKEYALTNWEEGVISLSWLISALSLIKKEKNIVGMDITGEYSQILIKNPIKRFLSAIDHPKQTAQVIEPSKIVSVNEATNLKILDLFVNSSL